MLPTRQQKQLIKTYIDTFDNINTTISVPTTAFPHASLVNISPIIPKHSFGFIKEETIDLRKRACQSYPRCVL